jgi:MFS family permease
MMSRISARSLAAVSGLFKLLQFMDRGVQNGSPLEFDVFIQRTTNTTRVGAYFGALQSIYTIGTVSGCVAAATLIGRQWSPHRLMRDGMLVWAIGAVASAFPFWMPDSTLTMASYCVARVVVGTGGGIVSLTWPPYVEATAASSERSLSMTLVETGTALGAALGFVVSPIFSDSIGWGSAYLVYAAVMLLLSLPLACYDQAVDKPRRTTTLRSTMRSTYHGASRHSDLGRVRSAAAVDTDGMSDGGGEGGGEGMTRALLAEEPAAPGAPPESRWGGGGKEGCVRLLDEAFGVCRLCTALGLAKFLVGAGFSAACLQGLQVFFPAIAVEIGLWPDEAHASTNFGAAIVGGTIFGGVAHGWVAEKLTLRLGRKRMGRYSEEHRMIFVEDHPELEARLLMLLMATTQTVGAFIAISLSRFMAARMEWPALTFILLAGAFLLGSLGLGIRSPLLLVEEGRRPVAVLLGTLAGYAGEFTGPVFVGALKDLLAPLCKTVEVNGTHVVDPRCRTSRLDQEGLGYVLAIPSGLALIAACFWMWSSFTIQPPGCCQGSDAGGSASGAMQGSRSTEVTRITDMEAEDEDGAAPRPRPPEPDPQPRARVGVPQVCDDDHTDDYQVITR